MRDVHPRIADHPQQRLAELLPWHWTAASAEASRMSLLQAAHRAPRTNLCSGR